MSKDELIRDLCSVEFRSKSKTRELVDKFLAYEYNVSEWKKTGIERGYWDYFKAEILNDVLDKIPQSMKRSRKEVINIINSHR